MELILHTVFGSHLYGLNTPASDQDFKGIYLPATNDVLLGRIQKSINRRTKQGEGKNTAADSDSEIYSLHYFLELAMSGQTVALDMLHSSPQHWISHSPLWEDLHRQRAKFYTRNLTAFTGYARKQAAKYGIKGSRLAAAREVLEVLYDCAAGARLLHVIPQLPRGEHIHITDIFYEVCGKKFLWNSHVDDARECLQRFVDEFGERAKLAEQNQGVDWKAISHAFRAAFQCRAIFLYGDYSYPLAETPFLKQIKAGEIRAVEAFEQLEIVIAQIEDLSQHSEYPERVDRVYWDEWLVDVMQDHVGIQ